MNLVNDIFVGCTQVFGNPLCYSWTTRRTSAKISLMFARILILIKGVCFVWSFRAYGKGGKKNDKLWEDKEVGFKQVVGHAIECLHVWKWARKRRNYPHISNQAAAPFVWDRPSSGILKCNVDASF